MLRRRRPPTSALAAALAIAASASPAAAQTTGSPTLTVGGLALEQLEPAPAGDALFSVPSPSIGGHLIPRGFVMFDYAHNPLQLYAKTASPIISSQGLLRLDLSLPLWDRALVSLDVPMAIYQAGHDPGTPGLSFHVPSSFAFGDIRVGARVRLAGKERGPIQIGLGGYLFIPSGSAASYTGDGVVRGALHALLGGKLGTSTQVLWSLTAGTVLRGSETPHTFTFGGGAALALAGERLRIGPEIYGAVPLTDKPMLPAPEDVVSSKARVNLEALLGVRVRLLNTLELGAAGGPGLSRAIGTPTFRVLALAAWSPAPPPEPVPVRRPDRDGDGIFDDIDMCPTTKGIASTDRTRNGCPKEDRDGDGVLDVADHCPSLPGLANIDPTKNGCPPDRDGDEIGDAVDACPDTPGGPSDNPNLNGCPNDRDGDGVLDMADACPYVKGPRSTDKARNGCPEDVDGDGIKPPADACPFERGAPNSDPEKNGCPKFVRVKGDQIVLSKPLRFRMYGRERRDLAQRITDEVLLEVRSVIEQHPEIKTIEVRGHADDSGDPVFNERIARERAVAVRLWFVEIGVPKEKLVVKAFGDTDPTATNGTLAGREKNRRVELFITERY